MTSSSQRPKRTEDIFPEALSGDRAYLVDGDMSRQPCVFYFRKSIGDDFATQVLRCLQYARGAGLRLDTSVGIEGVYYDDDKSGSKDIERPGYDHLMSDVMSGALSGRFIIVRDQDRLSRRESSVLEEYHVITELSKVRTFSSDGREIKDDLTTGIMAVLARSEAKIIGHRQRGRKEFRAIQGMPPASRVKRIGYTRGYTAIDWEEAKMLRRARAKVVAGRSLSGIVKEMKEQGIVKPNGKPYLVADLGRLLRNPAYAGLRVFTRDIEIEGKVIPKGEVVARGEWPRIFTEDEHYEVAAILAKNKSFSADHGPKYLLAGILVCAECGTRMSHGWKPSGKKRKDGSKVVIPNYHCQISRGGCGRVSRSARALESFFLDLTYRAIKRLPVVVEKVVDTTGDEIRRQQRKIDDAVKAFKDDAIDIVTLADIRQDAQAKIASLKKEQKVKPKPLPIDDADAFLNSKDVGKQRDTIRRFFPVVGVKPAGGNGVRFHPDQLVFPEDAK
ncbi:recombinase family protein [Kutzneria buriramensis]|uniref:DNA invertase Pin-like site-specific DNA recombinase n=1 Tax=Kutzneria buriramensis TaxID=1045776 RepID=A0A3E0HFS1_9PSEU|nr:recombinase family protein [Kutzneria buriramensis]REH44652.1 DNA invertase Pin-like site-specific DNA recombinase [Kutzneria buriramensis]